MFSRKSLTKLLKTIWGAHHFVFFSRETADIASVVNLSPQRLEKLMETPYWKEALQYWSGNPRFGEENVGDLKFAERLWTEMVEKGEHINLVDYPDKAFQSPPDNPDVFALLNSHLFCVDNLCDDEIRARLAEERQFESNPVRYEGQALENAYHWWVYPNYDDGIYSTVLARANVVGHLVVGTGDETSLVIIRHGRLTLTRQVSDDVVSTSDKRLLVCL